MNWQWIDHPMCFLEPFELQSLAPDRWACSHLPHTCKFQLQQSDFHALICSRIWRPPLLSGCPHSGFYFWWELHQSVPLHLLVSLRSIRGNGTGVSLIPAYAISFIHQRQHFWASTHFQFFSEAEIVFPLYLKKANTAWLTLTIAWRMTARDRAHCCIQQGTKHRQYSKCFCFALLKDGQMSFSWKITYLCSKNRSFLFHARPPRKSLTKLSYWVVPREGYRVNRVVVVNIRTHH